MSVKCKKSIWTIILIVIMMMTMVVDADEMTHHATASGGSGGVLNQIKDGIIGEVSNNIFDWVFGDPSDEDLRDHELNDHFHYLNTDPYNNNNNKDHHSSSLSEMVKKSGINFQFLNFKAHDYDNNDKIDGLELLALILHERTVPTKNVPPGNNVPPSGINPEHPEYRHQQQQQQQYTHRQIEYGSRIIDQLLAEEDTNRDGYLDYTEYTNARNRLSVKTNTNANANNIHQT